MSRSQTLCSSAAMTHQAGYHIASALTPVNTCNSRCVNKASVTQHDRVHSKACTTMFSALCGCRSVCMISVTKHVHNTKTWCYLKTYSVPKSLIRT